MPTLKPPNTTADAERLSLLERDLEDVRRSLEQSNQEKALLIDMKLAEFKNRFSLYHEERQQSGSHSLTGGMLPADHPIEDINGSEANKPRGTVTSASDDRNSENYFDEDDEATMENQQAGSSKTESEPPEHYFLPPDIYSYLACTRYTTKHQCWCGTVPLPSKAFSVACVVCAVQVFTLGIFLSDVLDMNDKHNPMQVPADVSVEVSASQLIALLISCFCQDEVRASFNVLGLGYHQHKVREISMSATSFKWYFSAYVRIGLGILNLIVTFILIVNSSTVRDVMLDFAAVTFVSELDNGAFTVAQWGYFGPHVKKITRKMQETPVFDQGLKSPRGRRRKGIRKMPRILSLLCLVAIMSLFWVVLKSNQMKGVYIDDTIFVQFGDDFAPGLGAFSGLYDIEADHGSRAYVSREIGPYSSGLSKFLYCKPDKSWVFQYGEEQQQHAGRGRCWSNARSSKTLLYDMVESSTDSWYVHDEESSIDMPLRPFYVSGQEHYYGKFCDDEKYTCGDRLRCENGKCVCNDDKFGLLCQFPQPCRKLELDERDLSGFTGTRTWSRSYRIIQEENKTNDPIKVYGKPVYIGDDEQVEGLFDVMIFTGRRWILTDSYWIQVDDTEGKSTNTKNKREFAQFLSNNFHAYWSNYTFFFTTEPVDVGTPKDAATPLGLQWYRLESASDQNQLGFSFKSRDAKEIWKTKTPIEANLFCGVCNDKNNPCFYDALCSSDGTCKCTTGSRGTLCQIPPDGNGFCDLFFNTPEFNYDGGDCCKETCRSSEEHVCGDGIIKIDSGLEARGRVGFPSCDDPRFRSKISGSVTLFEIIERGTVRCGFVLSPGYFELNDGIYSGFDTQFCQAIGAAVLGDPEAVEYVVFEAPGRFLGLKNAECDVLFTATYTAERDMYESSTKVGYSFTSSPYFYDGLKFGGVPPFINCADNVDFESAECIDLKICVPDGTSWLQKVKELFPDRFIVTVKNFGDQYGVLAAGLCNVNAGESNFVAESVVRSRGFVGPEYQVGNNSFSKEPLAPATREDDRVWTKFVSWVIQALIQAEAANITQATVDRIAPTDAFGEQFRDMFKHAVAANGNLGEIYDKTLESIVPRAGLNFINKGNNGLVYSFPFGNYESRGPDPITGGTIETIRKRGVLNCGVHRKRGFASFDTETMTWRGVDADICRGIAAALFNGSPNVNFMPLIISQRFSTLAAGTVDILAYTTTHTLMREVKEVGTGEGFDFSPPYFYDGLGFGGVPTFAKCADALIFDSTTLSPHCISTKICVPTGSSWLGALRGPLGVPEANLVVTVGPEESSEKFNIGDCNVIAGESGDILVDALRDIGYTGEFHVGVNKHTREPLAVVSRQDDVQFSDFVRWIIFGFFYAAENKITKETYYRLPASNFLFGDSLSAMWQHAIEASGNYEEILKRNFGEESSLVNVLNALNDENGPIFYPLPGITFD